MACVPTGGLRHLMQAPDPDVCASAPFLSLASCFVDDLPGTPWDAKENERAFRDWQPMPTTSVIGSQVHALPRVLLQMKYLQASA